MNSYLLELEKEWTSELKDRGFIGELPLGESDHTKISAMLGKELREPGPFRLQTVLVVLAVNAAYLYYDDEGFWGHFLDSLGLSRDWQSWLAFQIEKRLKTLKKQRRKVDGFRYVGAILEQCGITRRYIPSYSNILNHCYNSFGGWEGVKTIDYRRFKASIPRFGLSSYLTSYLEDRSGWEFTRDVAACLSQAQRGLITTTELEALPGFRSGFWKALLEHLNHPKARKANKVPMPRFCYDPEYGNFKIVFDVDYAKRGQYRLEGRQIYDYQLVVGNSELKPTYRVEIQRHTEHGESWETFFLEGWDATENDHALFHEERGFVGHGRHLRPGRFFLFAPFGVDVPTNIIVAGPDVVPICRSVYKCWIIDINSPDDVAFLGITVQENRQERLLSWEDERTKLEGARDVSDVFVAKIPRIICDHSTASGKVFRLFMDIGEGPVRCEPVEEKDQLYLDLNPLVKIPMKGRVWVEKVGRTVEFSGQSQLDELSFCILPECSVVWPRGLIGMMEKPIVTINSGKAVQLRFDEAYGRELGDPPGTWEIGEKIPVAEGVLSSGNVSVAIALRFFRAELGFKDRVGNVLTRLQVDNDCPLYVKGIPAADALLYLQGPKETSPLGLLSSFSKLGEKAFSTFDFRDAISALRVPAGQFAVAQHGTKQVPVNFYFVDCNKAISSIIASQHGRSDTSWTGLLTSDIATAVEVLASIVRGDTTSIDAHQLESLPEEMLAWAVDFVSIAIVLDGLTIRERQILPSMSPAVSRLIEWYNETENLTFSSDTDDFSRARELALQGESILPPPIDRWMNIVDGLRSRLKSFSEVDVLVEVWTEEIRNPGGLRCGNPLATLENGQALCEGWRRYLRGDFRNAYKVVTVATSGNGIVGDLSSLVAALCLLHSGRPEDALTFCQRSCHPRLAPFFGRLLSIAAGKESGMERSPVLSTVALPLREEDLELLA